MPGSDLSVEAFPTSPERPPGARSPGPPPVVALGNGQIGRALGLSGPLTPDQATEALSFYREAPDRFSAGVLADLQRCLGLRPTGVVDVALVQAVARAQQRARTPDGGAVDGRATPALLAFLLAPRDGFAGAASVVLGGHQEGVDPPAVRELHQRWTSLATPQARAGAAVDLASAVLVRSGVPAVGSRVAALAGTTGTFDRATWSIVLDERALPDAGATPEAVRSVVVLALHEARHAWQVFAMTRRFVTQALTRGSGEAGALAMMQWAGFHVPPAVVTTALARPLTPDSLEALQAEDLRRDDRAAAGVLWQAALGADQLLDGVSLVSAALAEGGWSTAVGAHEALVGLQNRVRSVAGDLHDRRLVEYDAAVATDAALHP